MSRAKPTHTNEMSGFTRTSMEKSPSSFTPRYTTNKSSSGNPMTLASSFCCWVALTSCTAGFTVPTNWPSFVTSKVSA